MSDARPSLLQVLLWRIEVLAFDLVTGLFALMPLETASAVGGALLRRLGPLTSNHKTARRNLMIAFPEMGEAEREKLLDAQWDNTGRVFVEFQLLDRLTPESGRIEVEGAERFEEIRKSGRPMILVSGHLSNWETMAMAIVRQGLVCHVAYRAANNPYINQRIVDARKRVGIDLLARKGEAGSREILAGLNRGQSVAMLVDQKQNDGILAPFFGVPAYTASGGVRLALRGSGMVQPLSVHRTGSARYKVVAHEPIVLERTGDRARDTELGVTRINAFIADRIREHPDQWFWVHRRWPREVYAAMKERGD